MDEQQNPYLTRIIKHMCDVINVDYTTIDFKEEGWYEGEMLSTGRRGVFPDNFVKVRYKIK